MSQTIDYSLDQHEDAVLVSMLSFFLDIGIPDDIDEKDFHLLCYKVFDHGK
jgi:hypothetical protein